MGTGNGSQAYRWSFFRAGGVNQVRLASGADLMNLDQLDQKLWVALACPTTGLEFDDRTLELIDADGDRRIRAVDVIGAGKWAGALLKNPDDLVRGNDALPLAAIDESTAAGKAIVMSAKSILQSRGKGDAIAISVADATSAVSAFEAQTFNGDGVITPDASDDDATRAAITDAIACTGGVPDKCGKQGLDAKTLDVFFAELETHRAWLAKGDEPAISTLGAETADAAAALAVVEAKIDDFFARVRLVTYDDRALAAANRDEKDYAAILAVDLSATGKELIGFPIARVFAGSAGSAGSALPLHSGVNPTWVPAMTAFHEKSVKPVLGERAQLSEADFAAIRGKLAAYRAWSADPAGASVQKLGPARVRELASGNRKAGITALLDREKAMEVPAQAIGDVEKLARFHRDLFQLCNNFVSFRDFYGRRDKAIFQSGTLYLDQRACELCIQVTDMAKHGAMASLARSYLAYCEITRGSEKKTIVAAFTAGDSENLMVGRNGVFYDRKGRDWDATIVKTIDAPISVRQAFLAPYKKLARFIEDQAAKQAAAADEASNARLASAAQGATGAAAAKPPEAKPKIDIGMVAALGVAVGGIAAAFGGMLNALFGLGVFMPLGFLALMLAISGPSMVIAYLKLRQRNLGPLLDANGWAVNTAAKINVPFGGSLTAVAALPPGSGRQLVDPFAEKGRPWKTYGVLVLVLVLIPLWGLGKLDPYLPAVAKRSTVFPAPVASPSLAPSVPAPDVSVPPPAVP